MVAITQFTAKSYKEDGNPDDPDVFIVIRPDGAPLQNSTAIPPDGIVSATFLAKMTDGKPIEQKFVTFLNPDGTPLDLIPGFDGATFLLKASNLSDLQSVVTARENLDVYSKEEVNALLYTDEQVRDTVGALLTAGSNMIITVDDAGNTINLNTKINVQIAVSDPAAASPITAGNGKAYHRVMPVMNGRTLTYVGGSLFAGSTAGDFTVQLRRLRAGVAVNILSTVITIEATETDSTTATTQPVIDAANAGVLTGDQIIVDITGAGANALGLNVDLQYT